jgi:hypothetical protein
MLIIGYWIMNYKKNIKEGLDDGQYHFEPSDPQEIGYPVCDYNCKRSKYEVCLIDGDC